MAIPSARFEPLSLLVPGAGPLLDAGCNVGALLAEAARRGVQPLSGIDVNAAALQQAQLLLEPLGGAQLAQAPVEALPFADGSFALAFCLEVLEHVPPPRRRAALEELHRVLRPGGRLCLSVPHAGAFAVLDPHNARFRFPRLHRLAANVLGGSGREAGFAGGSAEVEWHHHFSHPELVALADGLFTVEDVRYRGALLEPLTNALEWPFYRRGQPHHAAARALRRIREWERRADLGPALAYNVVLLLRRT